MKYLVGLGDSFTEGTGAYDDAINEKYNYMISPHKRPKDAYVSMKKNSWVNVLAKKLNLQPINLGQEGAGNRGSIKRIHLHPKPKHNEHSDCIVVFLASGLERFDFAAQDFTHSSNPKAKAGNIYTQTMWPNPQDRTSPKRKLWARYAEDVYSDNFALVEFYWNLMEIYTWCKAHNYKFYWSHAFDWRNSPEYWTNDKLPEHFVDDMPWDRYIKFNGFRTAMEMLCDYEGNYDLWTGGYWKHFRKMPKGSKYITKCSHPTVLGHQLIAEEMYKHIKEDLDV